MIFFEYLWAIISVGFMFFIVPIIIWSIQDYLELFKKYDWYELDGVMLIIPITICWWYILSNYWYV